MFKPRYLAELTLFSICLWMVYSDCSRVLLFVICRTLHLSGWSCINHWSLHFCNVSRSCCRVRRSSSDLILRYRLIIYGFTSRSRIFHLYGDVTNADVGLQNLILCSALRAFEHRGIFILPHLLWHGTSVFPVSSEGPPQSVASCDSLGDVEDLFLTHWSWLWVVPFIQRGNRALGGCGRSTGDALILHGTWSHL
jgi:hypothetical protein